MTPAAIFVTLPAVPRTVLRFISAASLLAFLLIFHVPAHPQAGGMSPEDAPCGSRTENCVCGGDPSTVLPTEEEAGRLDSGPQTNHPDICSCPAHCANEWDDVCREPCDGYYTNCASHRCFEAGQSGDVRCPCRPNWCVSVTPEENWRQCEGTGSCVCGSPDVTSECSWCNTRGHRRCSRSGNYCGELNQLQEGRACCRNPVSRSIGECPGEAGCWHISQNTAPGNNGLNDWFRSMMYCGGEDRCLNQAWDNYNLRAQVLPYPSIVNTAACTYQSNADCRTAQRCVWHYSGTESNWIRGGLAWFAGSGGCNPGTMGGFVTRNQIPDVPWSDVTCTVKYTGSCGCRTACSSSGGNISNSGVPEGSITIPTVRCGNWRCEKPIRQYHHRHEGRGTEDANMAWVEAYTAHVETNVPNTESALHPTRTYNCPVRNSACFCRQL